jgi:hypothetical protein
MGRTRGRGSSREGGVPEGRRGGSPREPFRRRRGATTAPSRIRAPAAWRSAARSRRSTAGSRRRYWRAPRRTRWWRSGSATNESTTCLRSAAAELDVVMPSARSALSSSSRGLRQICDTYLELPPPLWRRRAWEEASMEEARDGGGVDGGGLVAVEMGKGYNAPRE